MCSSNTLIYVLITCLSIVCVYHVINIFSGMDNQSFFKLASNLENCLTLTKSLDKNLPGME